MILFYYLMGKLHLKLAYINEVQDYKWCDKEMLFKF